VAERIDQIQTAWLETGDYRTYYRSAGQGDLLVLLHGAGGEASLFDGVLTLLAEDYRVAAPDLLGHGRTEGPGGFYTARAYGRWLAAFLGGLGPGPADIIGHSLGGAIALRFGASYPDRVRRLAVVNSISLGAPNIRSTLRLLEAMFSSSDERVLELVGKVMLYQGDQAADGPQTSVMLDLESMPRGPKGFAWMLARTWRLGLPVSDRLLERITAPVMVMWGEGDRYFPAAHARRAQRRLRNAELKLIPRAGHAPFLEQPRFFAAALRAFMPPG
jgi:pimeloyl-ACP methyl ester carboxylesterase